MYTSLMFEKKKKKTSYRALSWSHDAWALIALLSAILVLGIIVLVLLIRITRAPKAQVFFTNVSHVLDHNNIYLNDTLK